MRFTIEEIGEEGLDLTEDLGQPWLDQLLDGERKTGFWSVAPAKLTGRLEKVDQGVLVRGSLSAPLATECRRCLAQVKVAVPVSFTLNLVPREREEVAEKSEEREAGGTASFGSARIDEETFDGRHVDLEPIVREQILLALPMDALCREGCAGLCPSCGRDLNEGPCGCAPRPFDPRWEKLRSVKLSN